MKLVQPFLILGASKTGTSTAVAAANAHPAVFCLFECDFSRPAREARNEELSQFLPDCVPLFESQQPFAESLAAVGAALARKGWPFDWIGTKVQGIRPDLLTRIGDVPVLFMVRDVRTWAAKNRVISDVMKAGQDTNIVPVLIAYADYFLQSFTLSTCVHLRLDDLSVGDKGALPRALAKLLGFPQESFAAWWEKADSWRRSQPKNYSTWVAGHASAFVPPVFSDTQSVLDRTPFWDEYLPVFDKYFSAPNGEFSAGEVAADRATLQAIGRHYVMTLDDAFASFRTFKLREMDITDGQQLAVKASEMIAKEKGQPWSTVTRPK
jgi:hypothetical protein